MDAENCPFCGASVKKENLKGHCERVHPKRAGSLVQPKTLYKPTFIRSHRRRNILVLSLIVLVVAGISGGAYAAMSAAHGGGPFHWHPQLTIMIIGQRQVVPAQIGIEPQLWKSHELDSFGSMQPMPWMGMAGMSPLHTHDTSGTIHVESAVGREYTLQGFFDVWGVSVDGNQVLGHPVDAGHEASVVADGVEKSLAENVILADGQQIRVACEAI